MSVGEMKHHLLFCRNKMVVFDPSSGEIWCRCFARLTVNATPVHNQVAQVLTSTFDNFIQTTGIRDGASHYDKILSVFYDNLNTSRYK
jgi:hypothetical protein